MIGNLRPNSGINSNLWPANCEQIRLPPKLNFGNSKVAGMASELVDV